MKKTYITLLLVSSLFGDELSWVEEQVNAIKPPRNGEKNSNISKVKDPFITLNKYKEKIEAQKAISGVSLNSSSNSSAISNSNSSLQVGEEKPQKQSLNTFVLTAVINDYALINGNWYKEGQEIDKYRVKKITKTVVIISNGNKDMVLSTATTTQNIKFKGRKNEITK